MDNLVKNLMSTNLIVAHIDHSFTQICRLFFEMNIHHLPVLDDAGNLLGILSSNDALKAYSYWLPYCKDNKDKSLNERVTIDDIMTRNPITISPNAFIHEACDAFTKYNIQSLPVIENGGLVGIITSRDVIKAMSTAEGV